MDAARLAIDILYMSEKILSHRDLRVYQAAALLRRDLFVFSLNFPADEKYELRSQIRRSSRSVCASIGEAWRKRRYRANWISKLADCEQEAAESQIWIETAAECGYIEQSAAETLHERYEHLIKQLVLMAVHADKWLSE